MTLRRYVLILVLLPLWAVAQDKTYHGDGADDVWRFAPVAGAIALKACGVEGASSWKRLLTNTVTSYALSTAVTWGLKHTIHERRPDGTDHRSFPSGHATVACAGAHILYKEYGKKSLWYGIAGYGVAAALCIDRVHRNRHHWQDVCAGAAIGILGTEAGYRLGDLITGEQAHCQVSVGPQSVSLALSF